ncbi:hypothetical protein ATO46_12425 [Aeromonas schubertii]|uniref:autotransporter assembly complex protein TamB n=1 Tax=Aeromonas schubertii TaxID=652 RepID=UPI00067F5B11|nr:translocation/assembly module TamB domain-containing protein [Aeromonas schubertii]KUE81295.1 hypothetical protein ATO46_12425 [Aeromonas schubertii]
MNWIKQGLLWLLALLFLLLVAVSLLGFTHAGNLWLWQQARAQLPQLKGELVAGQLGYGWTLEGVGWQDELVDVAIGRVQLEWDLGQLLKGRLWVKRLEVDSPVVRVAQSQTAPEPQNDEPFIWHPLPLRVEVDTLRIKGLDLALPGLTLALKEGEIGARLTRHGLTVQGPRVDGLTVALSPTASAPEAAPAGGTPSSGGAEALTLPAVHLPFPLLIDNLALTHFIYRDGEREERVGRAALKVSAVDDLVQIERLTLEHDMASLSVAGKVTLSDDYPLSLTLDGTLGKGLLEELAGEKLRLVASGSVATLALSLEAKGKINATLKGNLSPLEPRLPFDARLNWSPLRWPLNKPAEGEAVYRLKQGSLTAKGNLEGYRFALDTAGDGSDLPPFTLKLAGEGDLNRLKQLALDLAALNGTLKVDGQLAWDKGLEWQGKAHFNGLDPHALVPEIKGELTGAIESRFRLDDKGWRLALPSLAVRGRLNQYPLSLEGRLEGNDRLEWQIPALQLTTGPNTLKVSGALTPGRWALDTTIVAPELAGLYPGLKGNLTGSVRVAGDQARPVLAIALGSDRLYYAGLDMRALSLGGDLTLGSAPAGKLSAAIASVRQEGLRLRKVTAELEGDLNRHSLTLAMAGKPLSTRLALSGSLQQSLWRGRLDKWELDTPLDGWQLRHPWSLSLDTRQMRAETDELCLDSGKASVCLDKGRFSAPEGSLDFALSDFDLTRLRPWLPDNFQWQALLSAEGRAGWKGSRPEVRATVRTTPGTLVSDRLKTPYQSLVLGVEMDARQASLAFNFASRQLGSLESRLRVDEPMGRGLLSGSVTLGELHPDAFAPLLPEVRELKGALAGQVRLEGTLARPLLYGELRLRDGEVQTHADMVTLSGLDTRLRVNGERAEIDGKVLVGKGPLTLGGFVEWAQPPLRGSLTIKGEGLEAQYPGMGKVRVTPDLAISLGEKTEITGSVEIPWARILVKSLPESAVGLSSDVQVVMDDRAPLPPPAPLPLQMRVQVGIGPDVRLDAMGLRTQLAGHLRLNQDEGKPLSARGEIQLNDGRFKAYGQNLLIQEGKIRFSGPLDQPYLNINAIRNPETVEDNVTVGVKVTGPATKPKISVYSDPAMSESERLSYLLRGKGLQTGGQDGGFNGLLVAGAVSQAGGVVSDIGETLGLSDVSLDTAGSGDETQVTLSAYLLPGLQLQYGVGVFSPIAEFKLRYELMPRLYLQALTGIAQAVDIFYRFEF